MNAARVSIGSGLLFVLLLGSLHLLEPEFDPTWRFISEYALGSFGWLMTLAFLALAASLASVGAVVISQARTVAGYIGLGVLGLGILGLLIAAIFQTDPISTDPETMTFSGKMHVLGASLDYAPVAFLLLSFSLARNQAWQPIRRWLFITAVITLICTVAFILVLPQDGEFGPGVLAGLVGRFLVLSYLGWVATAAFYALKLHDQQN
jgi:multisubunit Na+/H+ antiporter MnhC subunit